MTIKQILDMLKNRIKRSIIVVALMCALLVGGAVAHNACDVVVVNESAAPQTAERPEHRQTSVAMEPVSPYAPQTADRPVRRQYPILSPSQEELQIMINLFVASAMDE